MPEEPIEPSALTDPNLVEAVSHERLNSLIHNMADGVLALDNNLLIALYNGAAMDVLDVNVSFTKKRIREVLKPLDNDNKAIDIEKLILDTKTPTTFRDFRLKYNDGSYINLYLSIAPVRLGYGKKTTDASGYVLMVRDITREKSLEEERDEFISVISHELRTPVTIAEGSLSNALFVAQKTGDITKITQTLKDAHDQIEFLAALLNDLATLARAERGGLQINVEPINMHELLHELHRAYTPEANTKGLTLEISLDPKLEVVNSCRLYVHEILQNFITNALKYTDEGAVFISAKQTPNGIRVSVQDSGIGISKADQERIFEKFFRSEDYRTRKHTGTGLGLYVTIKLMKIIGASIDVTSELNKGSTFTITIPNMPLKKKNATPLVDQAGAESHA